MKDDVEKKVLDFIKFLQTNNFETNLRIFHLAQKQGYHILKARFYSPIPTLHELPESVFKTKYSHIDFNEEFQLALLEKIKNYSNEFRDLKNKGILKDTKPFSFYDAPIYYSIIRHFKPKNIVEVGAGTSTWIAFNAAKINPETQITAIDPFVRTKRKRELPQGINFIEDSVQNVPLSFFKELSKNDILFIDGTHVSHLGSDVNFIFLEVLPILNPGVLVHFHDIFLPYQYPKKWMHEKLVFWNEQYILAAFLSDNTKFEIMLAVNYLKKKHPEKLLNFYNDTKVGGASFWIRRT